MMSMGLSKQRDDEADLQERLTRSEMFLRAVPDLIFVMSPNNIISFDRYFDQYGIDAPRVGIPWDLPDREQQGMVLRPPDFDIILDMIDGRDRVWLVLNRAVLVTNNEDVDPVLRANFPYVEEHAFHDLTVIEYSLVQ